MKLYKRFTSEYVPVLKKSFSQFWNRDPFNNSIVIAYYTIFALPGLLVIIINVAGYFYDTKAVSKNISTEIQATIGGDAATDVEKIVESANQSKGGTLSTILGIAVLIFGATGVFASLQQMLNKIWGVTAKPKQAILKLVRDRLFSFGLIMAVGFLLLVSLVVSAALNAFSGWVTSHFSESLSIVFKLLDIVVSIAVIMLLFACIFKFLPDAKIKWGDVWHGAFLTAILFVIAKYALGVYFAHSDPASSYGAAGSIVLILLWVSYAGLILLFGAEFTQVYSTRDGKEILPAETAAKVN